MISQYEIITLHMSLYTVNVLNYKMGFSIFIFVIFLSSRDALGCEKMSLNVNQPIVYNFNDIVDI